MAELSDAGNSSGAIVRVPRSRRRVALALLVVLAFAAIYLSFVLLFVRDAVENYQAAHGGRAGAERVLSRADRWPMPLAYLVIVLSGLASTIAYARSPLLEIRPDGLKHGRWMGKPPSVIPWDRFASCHWNRYGPAGRLLIQHPLGQELFDIPKAHRAEVEAAIRRAGKWQMTS